VKFVQDNIWLVLTAIVSGAVLIWPWISRRLSGAPEVGPLEAVQLLNRKDALMLDVREPGEFGAGHAPGAKSVPLAQLEQRVGDIDKFKAKPVIVVCQTGGRSHAATSRLKQAGFSQVVVLAGGFNAWQQANLPVEKK
jgi:rhodanese-related sulfurtransferase